MGKTEVIEHEARHALAAAAALVLFDDRHRTRAFEEAQLFLSLTPSGDIAGQIGVACEDRRAGAFATCAAALAPGIRDNDALRTALVKRCSDPLHVGCSDDDLAAFATGHADLLTTIQCGLAADQLLPPAGPRRRRYCAALEKAATLHDNLLPVAGILDREPVRRALRIARERMSAILDAADPVKAEQARQEQLRSRWKARQRAKCTRAVERYVEAAAT